MGQRKKNMIENYNFSRCLVVPQFEEEDYIYIYKPKPFCVMDME